MTSILLPSWGNIQGQLHLIKAIYPPLPVLPADIEVYIGGPATSAVGLNAAAPLAAQILQSRQRSPRRGRRLAARSWRPVPENYFSHLRLMRLRF